MMADPEMERAFQQASVRSAVDPSAAAHWSNEFISGGGATSGLSNRNCHSLIDEFTQFQATGGGGASATIVNPELDAEWSKQFDSIRDSLIQGGGGVSSPASATQVLDHEQQKKWDEEFQEILKTPGTILQENVSSLDGVDLDWAAQFSNTWKNGSASTSSNEEDNWYSDFDQFLENRGPALASPDVDPDPISGPLQPYTFETENPYLSHPNPMEEGLALLNTGGSLSSAALAFEAVVQRDRNSSEAWMRLGMVQAENEKEHPAIAALQRSVKENNLNEKALMVKTIRVK